MPPCVSIILPARDAASTLTDAVESLRRQSFPDWELLVVDDGSTDGTPALARRFEEADPRIRLLQPGRVGLVEALRAGCAAARGAYLARMDADDIAHPDRLKRQLDTLEGDPEAALCGARVEDIGPAGEGRRRYSAWLNAMTSHEDVVREILVECPLAHPTFLMRRAPLEAVGGYGDRDWPEDYDLVLRLWRAGHRFAVAPGPPLLQWRDSPGRLSRRDTRYSPERFRACKLHHLLLSPLLPPGRPLVQWGAGQEGKAWLRAWPEGRRPARVVEVDPRKTGKRIHGVPVVTPEELGPPDGALLVVAVGAAGARDLIRPWLTERGWAEGRDFVFVA